MSGHVIAHDPFGDAARLRLVLALEGDRPRHIDGVTVVCDGERGKSTPNPRSRGNRRGEAHAVHPVIDCHPDTREPNRLPKQCGRERQCEKAVRDGRAERGFASSPRYVYVNPLAVVGSVGESVYARLSHCDPVADGNLFTQATFKALARALELATRVDPRIADQVPSTKGAL